VHYSVIVNRALKSEAWQTQCRDAFDRTLAAGTAVKTLPDNVFFLDASQEPPGCEDLVPAMNEVDISRSCAFFCLMRFSKKRERGRV